MKSNIFYSDYRKRVEHSVKQFLNNHDEFLSPQTAQSTRAVGDAIERILSDNFDGILGDRCADYQADFARRAMAGFYPKEISKITDRIDYFEKVKLFWQKKPND